jgi:uncharacterized membrane protein YfcA
MPEALSAALAVDGLVILLAAALLAGIVRGFAGFGSAMVYMPLASAIVSPVTAFVSMVVFDVIGPVPNIPRALRECQRKEVALLGAGLLVGLPLGLAVLTRMPQDPFRWAVALTALALLAIILSGWRYRRQRKGADIFGTGVAGGVLSGSTGMAGAPALILYLAGRERTVVIRANMILYLFLGDVISLAILGTTGQLGSQDIWLGLVIAPVYLAGNVIGALLFTEKAEKIYHAIAYVVIAISALSALTLLN